MIKIYKRSLKMNLEIKGAYIVQPIQGQFKVAKKDVFVQNGKIYYAKPFAKADRTINAENKVIMPAFVNAHHHIYSCLSKGIPAEVPFRDFLGTLAQLWWKLDRSLKLDDMILSTALTMEDCLKNGVTTVFDHHIALGDIENSLSAMADVFEHYGVSGTLAFELSDRNGKEIFSKTLAETVRFLKESETRDVKGMVGLHASFTLEEDSLQEISRKTGDAPIHAHVAEGELDETECQRKYGKTIIERLIQHKLLRKNSLLVHGSNINEKEIGLLKNYDIFMAQAVDSNMNNALHVANVHQLSQNNIPVTIGTDGMTSNILKSMKNSYLMVKYYNQNPDIGFPEMQEFLLNNYELKERFGFPIGLDEEKMADFVILDYEPATPFDENRFLGHFIFGITEARVQYVIKKDAVLLDNFHVNVDDKYADLKKRSWEISQELFKRFQEQ
jgi:cytosine/adenosine deaminase-related metal-dependent hydrolase